ncbi:AraC family transcriptional regulator [Acinetobacter nectaris]|uniref:AraC family transcriptional regulator n=1 Tax=Acinetobacter nectaris TaxID=1219382 RepID=UPI001F3BC88B|nr:helix-turn-helix transcriptional regulator [Acinetobacter nectaris]MCF8998136.1 helix-turn-helix transcriptional regulator [Acinetobacter nectaris]MCF9026938.1 helix-turn-helix transcriptional regulator [Acinetobacter nectaris]
MAFSFSEQLVVSKGSTSNYGDVIAPHSHRRAQLLYASQGTIRVHTPDNIWIVPSNCALWIPASIEHSVVSLSAVALNTALIEKNASDILGKNCFLLRMSNLLKELVLRLNQIDIIEKTSTPYNKELKTSLQLLVFDEIQRARTLPIDVPWPKDHRLIFICEQLINKPNIRHDLTIWSEKIGTSTRTLMRLFKKETGLPYRGWIQQMHIVLALGYLTEGKSISNISEMLGYATPSIFSAMFKKHIGVSPKDFR